MAQDAAQQGGLFVGGGGEGHAAPQFLLPGKGNRHGLITGATGTGKTVTLQILAEAFSAIGVPVFAADVKGDFSGIGAAGSAEAKHHAAFTERAAKIGYTDYAYRAFPVIFWDLFGEQGHPVRATVAEMGPLLLARLMDLTPAQEGVLNIAFRVSDEQGLPLLDLKDLQALLVWVGENASSLSLRYGNVPAASVGAIQRQLLVLETQGGTNLFGEPALELSDLMRTDLDGRGMISVLAADRLMGNPRLYATFLLWLLSQLFEELPEVGDPERPRLVFFFDEAHLLFDGAPRALVEQVETVARLIRSKGVGVYFCTQNPQDVPEKVLAQLGNRVQHALRAYTPREQTALRAAAQSYRPNPRFDTATVIAELGTGEAITSFLDRKGVPGVAERTLIRPPASQLGPLAPAERARLIATSPVAGKYDTAIDRDSAYEMLARRAAQAAEQAEAAEAATGADDGYNRARRYDPAPRARRATSVPAQRGAGKRGAATSTSIGDEVAKVVIAELKGTTGRRIVRGLFGTLFKGK